MSITFLTMAESCLLSSPSPKPNPSLFTPPSKLDPFVVHGVTKLSDHTSTKFHSHVYIFGQWLLLKWFFTQITDFSD